MPVIDWPTSSYGVPPACTCLVIALAPFKCMNGYLNLSPSAFSTYNALMFLDLEPGISSLTGLRCLINSLAPSRCCELVFGVPIGALRPSVCILSDIVFVFNLNE